jgi:hypothetical protein
MKLEDNTLQECIARVVGMCINTKTPVSAAYAVNPCMIAVVKEDKMMAPFKTDFRNAVREALKWATTSPAGNSAVNYLKEMDLAYFQYGVEGIQTQILYAMNNLTGWRGDIARASKATMKRYTKENPMEGV